MQRDTGKHGPRVDDALAKETRPLVQGAPLEPRAEEWREHEPAADVDQDVTMETAPPGALAASAVNARRELSRHLRLSAFPADREALLTEAEENDAPEPVLAALRNLPSRTEYRTVHEVWAALEGHADVREAAAHEPLSDADW